MADKEMSEIEPTTSSRTAAGIDASQIVSAYDWGALGDVIDVGGGDGTLLIALLIEYPALRGTVVDLPGTAETARKLFAAAGLADRGNAVAGDFFGTLPAGAEGYLLCSVLHRWDDEQARAILRNCATAAGEDGAVFVIEKLTDPTTPPRHDTQRLTQFTDAHDSPAHDTVADDSGSAHDSPADDGSARDGSADDGSAHGSVADDSPADDTVARDSSAHGSLARGSSARDSVAGRAGTGGRERARDVGELTVLAESVGLAAVAVHTADTVAIIELAVS